MMSDAMMAAETRAPENKNETLQGLGCPNCGGMVPIPEGQAIVICPFCDHRAIVKGENGLRRYQVPLRVKEDEARKRLRVFLDSSRAIAPKAKTDARLTESFLVYLPFWYVRAQVLGWVFGQQRVKRGKQTTYEPREIKIAEEMTWNGAAADVGEFGVDKVVIQGKPFEPYDYDYLHDVAMVFEPISAVYDAKKSAADDISNRVDALGKLSRVSQRFIRQTNIRTELVYYPLWVLRYTFRKRTFQLVIDGHTGQILYGKAPGSTMYRAAMLVGGAAVGAFLVVDAPVLSLAIGLNISNDDGVIFFGALALASIAAGVGFFTKGFKKFRYGEHYEFRAAKKFKRNIKRFRERGILRAREEFKS